MKCWPLKKWSFAECGTAVDMPSKASVVELTEKSSAEMVDFLLPQGTFAQAIEALMFVAEATFEQ